jgi:hypothetical protein
VTTSHAIAKRLSRSTTRDHCRPREWHESGQGHLPAIGARQDLRCAPPRTRHPARRHRHAGPGRTAISHRNAAHRQTRRHRTTRTLGKDHRVHQARLSITPAHWPAPGRQRTLCLLPGDSNPPEPRTTTTHSKEKRLLSISKPRRSPNTSAWALREDHHFLGRRTPRYAPSPLRLVARQPARTARCGSRWQQIVELSRLLAQDGAGRLPCGRVSGETRSDRLRRLGFGHDLAQGAVFVQVAEHLDADGLV